MTDNVENLFEHRLRATVRGVLDAEAGPHRAWSDAPAARRVAAGEGDGRSQFANVRLLAIAAVFAVAGAAAAGAFLRNSPTPPLPVPTPSPSTAAHFANGWVAFENQGDVVLGRFDGEANAIVMGGPGRQFCPQFLDNGRLAIADFQDLATTWQISVSTVGSDGSAGDPSFNVPIDVLPNDNGECFEASPDGQRFAFLSVPDPISGIGTLYAVAINGSLEEIVIPATPDFWQVSAFAWSADGTRLAVARLIEHGGTSNPTSSEVWVVEPNTRQPLRVLAGPIDELVTDVAWSPDGRRVAYRGTYLERTVVDGLPESNSHGSFIRTIQADAPDAIPAVIDQVRDPAINAGAGAAWSPDGTQLAWILDGELRVGDAGGQSWRAMQPVSSDELGLGWATGPVIWSPDGKHVMVGQLDTPELDPDAQYSVVVYELARDGQPMGFLPWGDDDPGRITWQALHE